MKGGGLSIIDARNIHIINSTFTNNQALEQGGGLMFSCNTSQELSYKCSLGLENTIFGNNQAGIEGGAIKWNYYEPVMTDVIFTNNSA